MPSQKRLAAVAHNIGHHATSGLCYVIPHLFRASAAVEELTPTLDLLSANPLPTHITPDRPLTLSATALQETFIGILRKAGFGPEQLTAATLSFSFAPTWPNTPRVVIVLSNAQGRHYAEDPAYVCTSRLTSVDGRRFEYAFTSWHYHA